MLQGIENVKATLERTKARVQAPELLDSAHDVAVAHWRKTPIPTDTGDLADSLRNPRSRNHVYRITGDRAEIGSKERSARYQAKRIKPVPGVAVAKAMGEYISGDKS